MDRFFGRFLWVIFGHLLVLFHFYIFIVVFFFEIV